MTSTGNGERRLAVVTGASMGIGAATAVALGARGWRVVLLARSRPQLEEVAGRVQAGGGEAVVEALDASDATAVAAMATRVREAHGAPHAIVNSAGAGQWKYLEETRPEELPALLGAPMVAALNVTQAFLGDMLAARRGVIVHVGSPASAVPWPGATAYTVSRWGLRGLHEALRQDLHGTGVASCHVVFGKVTSSYFDNNPDSEEHIPRVGRIIRTISPEEAARVILRTIDRPRPFVAYPSMMRAFYAVHAVAPGLTTWLARATGRRRPRP